MSEAFEPALTWLADEALAACREAIARHGGNEVFFVGRFDRPGGLVAEVEVLCQGNAVSVPALLDRPAPGEVVIHNHPSGQVLPSGADIQLAGHFGNNDVAFFIVDNAVEKLCVVVKPLTPRARVDVRAEAIEELLGPSGALSRAMPGFEPRPQQLRMAEVVADAFNNERIALIEAGTGTGKSLAYLAPAALWALGNEGRVLIATHTINLQEQLSAKDIPLLKRLEGMGIEAAVLKGRGNYLCLRKLEGMGAQQALIADEESEAIQAVSAWAQVTEDGTRSDLGVSVPGEVWEKVSADADDCNRVQCPAYDRCFYFVARRRAAGARLLIVNHHLLLADLFLRAEMGDYKRALVLPPAQHVILDEAHHLEDVATSYGSGRFSSRGVSRLIVRLRRDRRGRALGLIPALIGALSDPRALEDEAGPAIDALHERVSPRLSEVVGMMDGHLTSIAEGLEAELAGARGGGQMRIRGETHRTPFWTDLVQPLLEDLTLTLEAAVRELTTALSLAEPLERAQREPAQGMLLETAGVRNKLRTHAQTLRAFLTDDANTVRWMELERGRGPRAPRLSVRLCLSPIDVSGLLHDRLFRPMKTVVLTSATLAVGGRFDYLRDRVGLGDAPPALATPEPGEEPLAVRLSTLAIPTPFDLRRQVFFGVPTDLPSPNSGQMNAALVRLTTEAVTLSDGAAFVLFTAYSTLDAVFRGVEGAGLPHELLKQGTGPRSWLLDRFRADKRAVLFGADSFWEGVDVQGEALRLVILTRLPFRVPSEPVLEARAEAIAARGGDPFREMSVPQAVLRFKQGFGRLIRHRGDWGAVLVADGRLLSRSYGRYFLAAVEGVPVRRGPAREVLAQMGAFFAARRAGEEGD